MEHDIERTDAPGLAPLLYGNLVGTIGHNPQEKVSLPFNAQRSRYWPAFPDIEAVLFGVEQVQKESTVIIIDVDNELPRSNFVGFGIPQYSPDLG